MHVDRRRFLQVSAAAATLPVVPACGGHEKTVVAGVPANSFDEDSTAEEVTEGIDLGGKIAVVTGCTSGIGLETMRVLALRGAWVLGTSRSLERAEVACKGVRGKTSPLQLDLADFDSVVRCAETIRALNSPVDILVLNAGYRGGGDERQLIDGVEKHFRVNHLGHFLLVNRLLDRLYFAWQGRIVVVASRWAYRGAPEEGILFDDLQMSRGYSDSKAYGQSKLANVLFSLELGKLLRGSRITSSALHPGVINTEIDRNMRPTRADGVPIVRTRRPATRLSVEELQGIRGALPEPRLPKTHTCPRCQEAVPFELDTCPKCAKTTAKRQISGGNFILKGGGWYADLYSSTPSKSDSSSSESSGGSKSTSNAPASGGDSGKSASAAPLARTATSSVAKRKTPTISPGSLRARW